MSPRVASPSTVEALLARLEAPPGAWAYALRIWVAMMVALYAAFWLQLDSASSAATCVAILAQPKRGQALSKAFYRLLGTFVGFAVSIVIAGLFGQDRVLTLVAFGTWLGLCIFVANYLEGTRAYGALLSGYTVAIIVIANIDAPQSVFSSGIARVAALTLGVVTIALVNDTLGAPGVYPSVRDRLRQARGAVRAFTREALERLPDPVATTALIQQVSAPRLDTRAVVGEFGDGVERVAGARSAIAALFAQIAAARGFSRAATYRADWPQAAAEVARLRARVGDGLSGDLSACAELGADAHAVAADPASTPERVLLHRRAADILAQDALAADGMRVLEGGDGPIREVDLPIHRDFPDALRNATRAVLSYALSAAFLILGGWPLASAALLQLSATAALGAITPNPVAFSRGVLIGLPTAALCAGFVKFFVLVWGQNFAMLAIAMAPVIVAGCLISLRPQWFAVGFILIVFFPVLLAPSNPQTYDPESYLYQSLLATTAGLLLYLTTLMVLPTSDRQRRLWSLQSARADILEAVRGEPKEALERVNLDSDRLAQFAAKTWRSPVSRRVETNQALALAGLDTAAAGAQAALNRLAPLAGFDAPVRAARSALARLDAGGLRAAAVDLVAAGPAADRTARHALSLAVADLTAASHLIAREGRLLRRVGVGTEPSAR